MLTRLLQSFRFGIAFTFAALFSLDALADRCTDLVFHFSQVQDHAFKLSFLAEAEGDLKMLFSQRHEKEIKQIEKQIQTLAQNPKHPSLRSHKFENSKKLTPYGEEGKVWTSYVQQGKGAMRIIWGYTGKGEITIYRVMPHY